MDSTADARVSVQQALHELRFSPPAPLEAVNSPYGDEGPFLAANGLRLYFSSARMNGSRNDLWVAERSSLGAPFGAPAPVLGVNGSDDHRDPSLTDDELLIVFERQAVDQTGGRRTVHMASRDKVTATFDAPVQVELPDTTSEAASPHLSADGLVLYFATTRTGGLGGHDIWVAARDSRQGTFGKPLHLASVSSTKEDDDPGVTGEWMVLRSTRPGCSGCDIFLAHRPQPTGDFDTPVCVTALTTGDAQSDPHLNIAARQIVFTRGADIYVASF